jgi:hypothetical protein
MIGMCVGRVLSATLVALYATASVAGAESLPSKVDVRADNVAFFPYSNQTLIAADGHVVIRTGTRTISGDAARWDLLKNKLTVTGNVRVIGGPSEIDAVAYERDLTNGDAYVMKIDTVPATYAVHGDNMSSATEQAAPLGSFDAVDLDGQRPYMRSQHAVITPNGAVRMTPVDFPTGAGPALHLPTYLYTLVQNPYIAQSAAPSASFDQPYSLFGSPASLTAAHLRYDGTNGITEAIDNRLVDQNKAYLVTSVLPFRDKQFDLLSYQVIRPGLQQTLSATQMFSDIYPRDVLAYKLQESGKLTTETLQFNQEGASNSAEFDLATYEHDIKHLFGYQFRASYGYDHNYAGFPYTNDYRIGAYGLITLPSITVLGTSLGAKYEYSFTSYDYPHEDTSGTTTLSAGHQINKFIDLYAQAQFTQSDNRYRNLATGVQALGLPPPGSPYYASDGTPFPGYFAYAGLNTTRAYELQTTINGRGDNRLQITGYYNDSFPQFHGTGPAPLFLSVDVIRRITPSLRIELGRSYSFGWNHQYLSPTYTFAVSP